VNPLLLTRDEATKSDEYRLRFFLENGFKRNRCEVCGTFFWTLDEDRTNCGDAPCLSYTFIGKRGFRRAYSVHEMRDEFLKFFEERGHQILKPYPVAARWRDDIYLTIASIAVFQPFVTSGLVPAPANPLVLSQPCIRLTDIDNVGLTVGRHLTIFEMGGAHAFNYPDKYVYWKDETVRFCHEFLCERLGLKPELITYKEDFWEGGGNAGPDVEVCSNGLELATLVFMCYKVQNHYYQELPLKIVDTGYGIERFTWFSTGQPSAFHAIYGRLLDDFLSIAGLKGVDEKILAKTAEESATMQVGGGASIQKLRVKVAAKLGMDPEELDRILTPVEYVYALLDHTKCLAFMLADGIVPSNTGEGYLARLVLRRALKLMHLLKLVIPLSDLVDKQITFWADSFPTLKERRDKVLEEISIEEAKYKAALSRGKSVVLKYFERSKGKFDLNDLIKIYDSHGIPPEVVKEVAQEVGVNISLPDNFYALVAKLHEKPVTRVEERKLLLTEEEVKGLPPTRPLYYESPYTFSFNAKVLKSLRNMVILDQTAFYPEGGGQPADKGYLEVNGSKVDVIDVQKVGEVIVHVLEKPIPEGVTIHGVVDLEVRLSYMRHHTATHIVLGAAREVLGAHIWQAGAQKGLKSSRLDITHYKRISPEEIKRIEILANEVVMRRVPVRAEFMNREEAERLYGFTLYQGGVIPGRKIRVVSIGDWNVQACGGTHVTNTIEVGAIKIIRVDRIQDGVERLEYVAGLPAIEYFQEVDNQVKAVAEVLNVSRDKVVEASRKLREELKEYRKRVEALQKRLAEHIALSIQGKAETINGLKVVVHEVPGASNQELITIGGNLTKNNPTIVAFLYSLTDANAHLVVMVGSKTGLNAGALIKEVVETVGGKGGGEVNVGQGLIKAERVTDAVKSFNSIIRDVVKGEKSS